MQKIVLFIRPKQSPYATPHNMGNLFVNRLAISEEAACEVLNIFEQEFDLPMIKYGLSNGSPYSKKGKDRSHFLQMRLFSM